MLLGLLQGVTELSSLGPSKCSSSMNTNQNLSASIYRQLFTDAEWDAISSALKDYSDYGDEESNIADSIDAKINTIFRLTSN